MVEDQHHGPTLTTCYDEGGKLFSNQGCKLNRAIGLIGLLDNRADYFKDFENSFNIKVFFGKN